MNASETALLLSLAAAFDQRTIGEADVLAWADLLAGVAYPDAQAVVKAHYATKRDRVMPVDVIDGVRKIRAERIARHEHELCPPPGLDGAGYRDWLRQSRQEIADGTWQPPEAPPVVGGRELPEIDGTFRTIPGEVA